MAIVGAGIAGLSAAWYLRNHFQVTLFEKHPRAGIGAHAVEQAGGHKPLTLDIPFRTLKEDYYHNLLQLFTEAEIPVREIDYSFTIARSDREPFFGFQTRFLGLPWSIITATCLKNRFNRKIFREMYRFYNRALEEVPEDSGLTIDEYLSQKEFSKDFRYLFLYPLHATINTCTIESVARYPALAWKNYHTNGNKVGAVLHAETGSRGIAARLTSELDRFVTGANIRSIDPKDDTGVRISWSDEAGGGSNHQEVFDFAIVSTQANQAARLLSGAFERERRALESFSYESSYIMNHTDDRYMPRRRRQWLPVSFLVPEAGAMPAGTIWLNQIIPELKGERRNIFQTWNPVLKTPEEKILGGATFERPVVDFEAEKGIDKLNHLHGEPKRRLFFSGSYAIKGIPLLEAGVTSSRRVCELVQDAAYPALTRT